MKIKSGGGITSNKYVTSKAPKVEPRSKAMSPEAVAQQGAATAFKKPPLVQGPGYTPAKVGATGVGKATVRPDTPGPGSGRTTYASGSQGSYGPVVQGETNRAPDPPATAPGKDILGDFGPESRSRKLLSLMNRL
jgi:hypothetical protein